MEENYDVLGKFKGLSGANIFRNYKASTAAQQLTSSDSNGLDDSAGALDLQLDLDSPSFDRKSKSDQKSSGRRSKLLSPVKATTSFTVKQKKPEESSTPVARRTRSSLSSKSDVDLTEEPSVSNAPPVKETRKGRRGRRSINNIDQMEQEPSNVVIPPSTSRRRGRTKRTDNAANASANNSIVVDLSGFESQPQDLAQPSVSSSSRHPMQARRQCISGMAARGTVVDSIDLVSAPVSAPAPSQTSAPRVLGGVINIDADSDDDLATGEILINSENPLKYNDDSFDLENPLLNVKINWFGKPEVFKLRKYQKFSGVLETLAEREKVEVANIILNLDDQIIDSNDTPASINYKIYQFIDGRVMKKKLNTAGLKKRSANTIKLKVQSDKWKKPLEFQIEKNEKLRILFIKCGEELKMAPESFKFSFDGEYVDPNHTPIDLEMEGGEILEVRF